MYLFCNCYKTIFVTVRDDVECVFYREQRVTGICIHTLIGLSVMLTTLLRVSTFLTDFDWPVSLSSTDRKREW